MPRGDFHLQRSLVSLCGDSGAGLGSGLSPSWILQGPCNYKGPEGQILSPWAPGVPAGPSRGTLVPLPHPRQLFRCLGALTNFP